MTSTQYSNRNALTTIPFHGASLVTIPGETPEKTMVAIRPVAEGMGINFDGQRKRLARHPVLKTCTAVLTVQMPGDDQVREHTFLPLNRLHFWMATVSPNHVPDPEVRERVILFQTEAADVLFDHFFGKALGGKSDEMAVRTNGISRMLAKKVTGIERVIDHLTEQLNGLIITTDARRAALEYMSVREMLNDAGAIQRRRNGLNRKIGNALRSRALLAGVPSPCRRCPHSGVWLFQRDFAAQYMADHGKELVIAHNEKQMGQGVLRFPNKRDALPGTQPDAAL